MNVNFDTACLNLNKILSVCNFSFQFQTLVLFYNFGSNDTEFEVIFPKQYMNSVKLF